MCSSLREEHEQKAEVRLCCHSQRDGQPLPLCDTIMKTERGNRDTLGLWLPYRTGLNVTAIYI